VVNPALLSRVFTLAVGVTLLVGDCRAGGSVVELGSAAQITIGPAQQRSLADMVDRWRRGAPGGDRELEASLLAGGSSVVPALIAWVDASPGAAEVPLLVGCLPKMAGEGRQAALIRWSLGTAEPLRLAAVTGLGSFEESPAVAALLAATDDPSEAVRAAAGAGVIRLERMRPDLRLAAALGTQIRKSTHPTSQCLLLAQLSDDQANDILIGLAAEAGSLQLPALCGLWNIAGIQDGEFLTNLLRNAADPAIERKLCLLIGRIQFQPAARLLIDRLGSEKPGLAADALWALRQATGEYLGPSRQVWEQWWTKVGAPRERERARRSPATSAG
jgi:hypothetical protein